MISLKYYLFIIILIIKHIQRRDSVGQIVLLLNKPFCNNKNAFMNLFFTVTYEKIWKM